MKFGHEFHELKKMIDQRSTICEIRVNLFPASIYFFTPSIIPLTEKKKN
jgi:hypothetical protein